MQLMRYCDKCGEPNDEKAAFCFNCGTALRNTTPTAQSMPGPQTVTFAPLRRDTRNAMIGGVCAGIAKQQRMDVDTVRLLAVLIALFTGGTAILAYIIMWILIPPE